MKQFILVAMILAVTLAMPSQAQEPGQAVEGSAVALDGETLAIDETRLRLFAVDAPSLDSPFGWRARAALDDLITGRYIACRVEMLDPAGLPVAQCFREGVPVLERNLTLEMIRAGYAVLNREHAQTKGSFDKLLALEREARENRRGLWANMPK